MNTKQFEDLLEIAKKDKKVLEHLKNAAVKGQMYELASNIRDIEKENFPETEEDKSIKKTYRDANLLLRMVDVNASEFTSYKIGKAFEVYNKKKGKFDTGDAVKIINTADKYFNQ